MMFPFPSENNLAFFGWSNLFFNVNLSERSIEMLSLSLCVTSRYTCSIEQFVQFQNCICNWVPHWRMVFLIHHHPPDFCTAAQSGCALPFSMLNNWIPHGLSSGHHCAALPCAWGRELATSSNPSSLFQPLASWQALDSSILRDTTWNGDCAFIYLSPNCKPAEGKVVLRTKVCAGILEWYFQATSSEISQLS